MLRRSNVVRHLNYSVLPFLIHHHHADVQPSLAVLLTLCVISIAVLLLLAWHQHTYVLAAGRFASMNACAAPTMLILMGMK